MNGQIKEKPNNRSRTEPLRQGVLASDSGLKLVDPSGVVWENSKFFREFIKEAKEIQVKKRTKK